MKKVKMLFLSALALVGMAGCQKEEPTYKVTFKNWDGSVVEVVEVKEGEVAQLSVSDPTREEEFWAKFEFAGWDREVIPANWDAEYVARYDVTRKYAIKFLDWDGSQIGETQRVLEGEMPVAPTGLTHEDRGYTHYDFIGWNKEIVPACEDTWYSAQFKGTYTHLISFVSEDGSVTYQSSRVPEGVLPEYKGATPTKADEDGVKFTFAGWDKEVSLSSGDTIYYATFDAERYDWSAEAKELMLLFVEELIPFFPAKEEVPWYFDDYYECISTESWEDAGDIAEIFAEAGYEYDDAQEAFLKPLGDYENWYIIASIYDDAAYVEDGEPVTTYVDIYAAKIVPEPDSLEGIMKDILYYIYGVDNAVLGEDYMEDGEGGYWTAYSFGSGTEDDLLPLLEEVGYYVPGYCNELMAPEVSTLTTGDVCAYSAYYTASFNIVEFLTFINGGKIILQISVYSYF